MLLISGSWWWKQVGQIPRYGGSFTNPSAKQSKTTYVRKQRPTLFRSSSLHPYVQTPVYGSGNMKGLLIPAKAQGTAKQSSPAPPSENPYSQPDEPMQIGHSKLSSEEWQRRRVEGACFYCGKPGHQVNKCSVRLNSGAPR